MYHFDWLQRHAERTPHKLAVVEAHGGRQFNNAQFNERAKRLAAPETEVHKCNHPKCDPSWDPRYIFAWREGGGDNGLSG
jgi:hypothetical protein